MKQFLVEFINGFAPPGEHMPKKDVIYTTWDLTQTEDKLHRELVALYGWPSDGFTVSFYKEIEA